MRKLFILALLLSACAGANPRDPYESLNRAVFKANRAVYSVTVYPVSDLYEAVAPKPVRAGVHNFLANLGQPIIMLNLLLQGEGEKFGEAMGRFIVNTSMGVAGLFDVATDVGITDPEADFGLTLGKWGYKDSAYVVLPVLGPSTVRDMAGRAVDSVMDPVNNVARFTGAAHRDRYLVYLYSAYALDYSVSARTLLREIEKSSLDFYASLREAYLQRRAGLIGGGAAAYDFSMEDDDE